MGSYISHYWNSEPEKIEEIYPVAVYQEPTREFSIKDNVAMMWLTTMFFANIATRDDYGNIYIIDKEGEYIRVVITE